MKTLINRLGLTLISLLFSSNVLAQVFYPSSSFFSPAANMFRGSATDPLQWLQTNDAQVFGFLISTNNLTPELNSNDNIFTVLVPTDRAFAEVPTEVRERLSEPGQMEELLKYHFIPQIITDKEIKKGQVNTLEGSPLKISGQILSNQDTEIKLNEATAQNATRLNDNLIVVVIDQVLLPPNF